MPALLKISKNLNDANKVNGNAKMELALVTTKPKTCVNDPDSVRRNIEAVNDAAAAQTGLQKCAFVFVIGIGIAVLIIVTFYFKS